MIFDFVLDKTAGSRCRHLMQKASSFVFLAYERELSDCSTPLLGIRIVTDDRLVPRGIHGWYQEP